MGRLLWGKIGDFGNAGEQLPLRDATGPSRVGMPKVGSGVIVEAAQRGHHGLLVCPLRSAAFPAGAPGAPLKFAGAESTEREGRGGREEDRGSRAGSRHG